MRTRSTGGVEAGELGNAHDRLIDILAATKISWRETYCALLLDRVFILVHQGCAMQTSSHTNVMIRIQHRPDLVRGHAVDIDRQCCHALRLAVWAVDRHTVEITKC